MSIQLGPEWDEFQRRLEQFPARLEADVRAAMTTSLVLIEADARRTVQQDTRRLAGSISSRIEGQGLALQGVVGPSVQYGIYVEFGRRAGARMPPVDALIGWVQRHTPRALLPRRGGRRDDFLRSRAFALARAISRRGIPPRPFMRPAYTKNLPTITRLFDQVGVRITAFLAGQPL
ncbi:MAG TPA: HK97 gp10 family phage protein [Methylomirabilota bacterium]|nr:HK97 gp10 family phage protein [Methylomirabilota bacterium]